MARQQAWSFFHEPKPENSYRFVYYYALHPIEVDYGSERLPVHYLECGRRGNPLIILWHGVGSRAGQFLEFSEVMQSLAREGFHVIAPDLPGHGKTPSPNAPENFAILVLANLLQVFTRKIIDKFKSPSCVWIAHSLSAGAAVVWTSLHAPLGNPIPELQGICIVSLPIAASVPFLMRGALLPGSGTVMPPVLHRCGKMYFLRYIKQITNRPELRDDLLDLCYPRSTRAIRAEIQFIKRNVWLLRQPEKVLCVFQSHAPPVPLCFVHGNNDTFFPAQFVEERVRSFLPEALFAILEGGHNIVDDNPSGFVAEILQFSNSCKK